MTGESLMFKCFENLTQYKSSQIDTMGMFLTY